jgi:catechol 2,3-dioxygenase-like lactoylglutathione lyase family enzyme
MANDQPGASLRWTGVCLDCADAEELAAFYSRLLGYEEARRDGPGWIVLRASDGGTDILLQAEEWYEPPVWPEQPGGKDKMLHFEIEVDDHDLDAAVAHALAAGARLADHQPQEDVRVMLDPAGHPFCLF